MKRSMLQLLNQINKNNMAKSTYSYSNPRKLLANLGKELSQREIQHTNQQIKDIVNKRKEKIKSIYLSKSHQVIQPGLLPTRNIYPEFTTIVPIASEQPFISEKVKENILKPQRFYSRQPNMKAGSFSEGKKCNLAEKQVVISRKFEEYSRIVDDQSGSFKIQKLAKLMQHRRSILEQSSQKYTRMKKTYFQKFIPDKYNFYNPPSKASIGADSTSLRRSRTKVINISQTDGIELNKEVATLGPKQARTNLEADLVSQINKEKNKSMMVRSRIKTVVTQKNLQSMG